MTTREVNMLVGRVLSKDGFSYTVTSASTTGDVCVWDPQRQVLLRFDSRETFEHWARGTPVVAAAPERAP